MLYCLWLPVQFRENGLKSFGEKTEHKRVLKNELLKPANNENATAFKIKT